MIPEQNINLMVVGGLLRMNGVANITPVTTDMELGILLVKSLVDFLVNNNRQVVFELGDLKMAISLTGQKQPEDRVCN